MTTNPPDELAQAEAAIRDVVDTFYDRVRQDPELGPVFNRAVENWDAHLDRITAFWSSAMLRTGRYDGGLMGAHFKHRGEIAPEMFCRWLALWAETTSELLPEAAADAMRMRAQMIADSLKQALFYRARAWAPSDS
jgi:hemoglobin